MNNSEETTMTLINTVWLSVGQSQYRAVFIAQINRNVEQRDQDDGTRVDTIYRWQSPGDGPAMRFYASPESMDRVRERARTRTENEKSF